MGEIKRKKKHVGGKEGKKKIRAFETPRLALHGFPAFQLTEHIGPQSVYVCRALCIIVLPS